MKETLTIFKDTCDSNYYVAKYSINDSEEAHQLAYKGTLIDAITESLNVWGLSDEDVYIVATS